LAFKRILDECFFATFSGRACEAKPLSGYAENIIEGYLSRVPERLNVVRAEPDNFISRLMEQEGMFYFFKHENGKHTIGAHFSRVCCLLEETSSTRVTVELMDGGRVKMRIQLTIDINGEAGDVGKLVP